MLAEREMGLRPYFIPVEAEHIGLEQGELVRRLNRSGSTNMSPSHLFGEKWSGKSGTNGVSGVWRKGENGWQSMIKGPCLFLSFRWL